jgi:hypothetical protein
MQKARRRALMRETTQVALLVAVDWLFVHWPESRLPLADRSHTLTILFGVNVLLVADVWLTRTLPRWRARVVAATWCRSEREKFLRRQTS